VMVDKGIDDLQIWCGNTKDPTQKPVCNIAENCPGMTELYNTQAYNLSAFEMPPNTHVLFYGNSFMKEPFEAIRRVNEILGNNQSIEYVAQSVGEGGCCCGGGKDQKGTPYCEGLSNCDCRDFYRVHLKGNSSITLLSNLWYLQVGSHKDQLAGVLKSFSYTHAMVMEPHRQNPSGMYFASNNDNAYGCGWPTTFWGVMNAALPGKIIHVTPWGFDSGNSMGNSSFRVALSAPTPTISLAPYALNCSAETRNWTVSVKVGDPYGHQCMAAKDHAGSYVGSVPFMAQKMVSGLWGFTKGEHAWPSHLYNLPDYMRMATIEEGPGALGYVEPSPSPSPAPKELSPSPSPAPKEAKKEAKKEKKEEKQEKQRAGELDEEVEKQIRASRKAHPYSNSENPHDSMFTF